MKMAKGNPNPSPETRWKKGQSGNPSGRSSEELKNMTEAAKIASKLTLKALTCLQEKVEGGEELSDADLCLLLSPDTRGMIKEAQDRAHGTPRQSIEHSGDEDKPIAVTGIERIIVKPDASK